MQEIALKRPRDQYSCHKLCLRAIKPQLKLQKRQTKRSFCNIKNWYGTGSQIQSRLYQLFLAINMQRFKTKKLLLSLRC